MSIGQQKRSGQGEKSRQHENQGDGEVPEKEENAEKNPELQGASEAEEEYGEYEQKHTGRLTIRQCHDSSVTSCIKISHYYI